MRAAAADSQGFLAAEGFQLAESIWFTTKKNVCHQFSMINKWFQSGGKLEAANAKKLWRPAAAFSSDPPNFWKQLKITSNKNNMTTNWNEKWKTYNLNSTHATQTEKKRVNGEGETKNTYKINGCSFDTISKRLELVETAKLRSNKNAKYRTNSGKRLQIEENHTQIFPVQLDLQ